MLTVRQDGLALGITSESINTMRCECILGNPPLAVRVLGWGNFGDWDFRMHFVGPREAKYSDFGDG